MHNCLKFQSNLLPLFEQYSYDGGNDYWYLNAHSYHDYTYRENVFTEDELTQIIVIGNSLSPQAATIGKGTVDDKIRISQTSWIRGNFRTKWLFERLTRAVMAQNEEFYGYDLTKIESLQFTRYTGESQAHYTKHVDPHHHINLPHNRKLSFVVHLSDPSEYTGGELHIHVASKPIVANNKRGNVSFFPSHCLHEVTPVTSGTRYTLVGWVHGAPLK